MPALVFLLHVENQLFLDFLERYILDGLIGRHQSKLIDQFGLRLVLVGLLVTIVVGAIGLRFLLVVPSHDEGKLNAKFCSVLLIGQYELEVQTVFLSCKCCTLAQKHKPWFFVGNCV